MLQINDIEEAALIGYVAQLAKINDRIEELRAKLHGRQSNGTRTRVMSAAGRARIAAAQRKRWAAQKKAAKSQLRTKAIRTGKAKRKRAKSRKVNAKEVAA